MSITTNYDFSEDQNSHFLRQILQFFSAQKMMPTPVNYALIYEHVSGSNQKLSSAIEILIKQQRPFNTELVIKLYYKYINDTSLESFDRVNNELESLINKTRKTVEETSQKASDAGIAFEEQAASAAVVESNKELQKVISDVVAEATGLAKMSQSLKAELDSTNQEMESLRAELIRVREAAATDALTGLLNRGSFDMALNKLISQGNSTEGCLVMLDLDFFKKVNDTYGHLIGDSVLKFTGNLLKKHAEPQHSSVRYGGEELAIIMPETSLKKSAEIAEKIRSALEKSRLKKRGSSESIGKITVSIGITRLKEKDTSEDCIMRADNALYQAKGTGRNKVVIM